ncbi:MAG: hypothetical protein ACI9FN_002084 [Saprospiraceae bacterium]
MHASGSFHIICMISSSALVSFGYFIFIHSTDKPNI